MYFVDVSSQAPIVLQIPISYVFHLLLYTYVYTTCMKRFIHVQNMYFL